VCNTGLNANSTFGGAFTSGNAGQNWWTEWSVELATAAPAGRANPNMLTGIFP